MQLRSKLTVQFIVIVAGILLVSLMFIFIKWKEHHDNEFYRSLKSKAAMTAEMLIKNETDDSALASHETRPQEQNYLPFKENILIYNAQNQRIYSFNPMASDVSATTLDEVRQRNECRFSHEKLGAIGILYKNNANKQYIVVAEAVYNATDLLNLRNILIWDFLIIIAVVAFAGWIFAGRALQPVSNIMNQVDKILPSDLSKRLNGTESKDELSRLVFTFNKLLERIEYAFKMQKSFLSNVSHELKNPMAVMTSQLEVALSKERSSADYQKTMHSVLEDVKSLNDVTEKLMQLAKISDQHNTISFQQVRLDELIWQAKSWVQKTHPDYKVIVDMQNLPEDDAHLCVLANEQLLKTALINLIENGCKFSPNKRVQVRLDGATEKIKVEIIDNGPGINASELPMIFEPFYRSKETIQIKGSGIGLSLVNSILKLHNVVLQVSSVLGKGTTFSLSFNPIQ